MKLQDYSTTPRLLAQISSQIFLSNPYLSLYLAEIKYSVSIIVDP